MAAFFWSDLSFNISFFAGVQELGSDVVEGGAERCR
jgi:hypothetical protein